VRILRIRRGFTTNSSGANEWLTPPKKAAGKNVSPSGTPLSTESQTPASESRTTKNVTIMGSLVAGVVFVFFLGKLGVKLFKRWRT
jgi:hypothetical protein